MATYKQHVRKTEAAHQDVFLSKGYEPTNYAADSDLDDPKSDQSGIFSKLRHNKTGKSANLTTMHNHKTGKITHKWELKEEMAEDIDEALVSKALLARYRAKAKTAFKEKGGINAALEKQAKEGAAPSKRFPMPSKPYRQSSANEEAEQIDEIGFANKFAPLKKTAPNSGYMNVGGGKKAFNSSNPDMRINRRAGLDKDIDWENDGKGAQAKQAAKMAKFQKKAAVRKEDMDIVDLLMVEETLEDAAPYISEIEARCDAIVNEAKEEMRKSLFAFGEGHTINQLKQAADAHRLHKNANERTATFAKNLKPGSPTEDDYLKKAGKHNKARMVADRLRFKMQDAGVSHSSKLPKETDDQRRGGLTLKKIHAERAKRGME